MLSRRRRLIRSDSHPGFMFAVGVDATGHLLGSLARQLFIGLLAARQNSTTMLGDRGPKELGDPYSARQ